MNTIPVSLEVLATVLGTTSGSLSDALKADEKEEWKPQTDIDAYFKTTFNTKLKSVRKEGHDEGHGRGTRETLSTKEKEIKDRFGLKGQTLDELFEEVRQASKDAGSGLTDEAVRNHPAFKDAVEKLQKKVQEKDTEIKTIQESVRTKEIHGSLRDMAMKIIGDEKLKFILPEDQSIRETQVELFLDLLKKNPWKKEDGGELIPLKGDEPLKDDSYNPVSGFDYARGIAQKMWPQAKAESRTAPGVNTKAPNGQTQPNTVSFPRFATREEALSHISTVKDPAQLDALKVHIEGLVKEGVLQ